MDLKNNRPADASAANEATPVCPYCQRRFRSMDDLTLHVVTRHTQSGKLPTPAKSGGAAR